MRRALWVLIVAVLVVAASWQLFQMGGTVEVRVGELFIGVSLPILLVALVVLFALLHGILLGLRWVGAWPGRFRARREASRRHDGDLAVTRALLALAAGRGEAARTEARRARNKLGDTPQTLLLAAEADRLAGRDHDATETFRLLAAREDARFLGLRGLLRESIRQEKWEEAAILARQAEEEQPQASWVRTERASLALRTHDWSEALALGAPEAPEAQLAMAAAAQETDDNRITALEKRALAADPGFTPAALAHARRFLREGSPRRARSVLEKAWEVNPHPDIAAFYLTPEVSETKDALGRAKAAEHLVHKRRDHPESRLVLARADIEAALTGRARAELDALIASGSADRRAWMLRAELEHLEQGESPEGRAAEARCLREAANAAPEPRWRCASCGTEHESWKPVCTSCGTVGRIAWG
ncbi:heme biosynthesis protein HemY [Acetobacteraceae bacterium H6797]|nr:heme biosynthesis protein HemY [Acetobacteraceae bacterium H6797]